MSSDAAIRVRELSKCYQIYASPRDRLKQFFLPRLRRWNRMEERKYFHEFWALRGVTLDIAKGETVGIIGRNGSGKSTLLQMICGTLTPTSGTVETSGRIAALLELGAGFNPEFTGRENVYMSASLYGLGKEKIDERFEQIARFADIGDFIEEPVKTYSSGMYVRLAFAVIAHVDADILVIDEALSVGDAIFTQKCMRFIRAFQERGTLLFVSHDMNSVLNLCRTAVWLSHGEVCRIGAAKEISEAYLHYTLQEIYGEEASLVPVATAAKECEEHVMDLPAAIDYQSHVVAAGNIHNSHGWRTGAAEILDVRLEPLGGGQGGVFKGGEQVRMVIRARAEKRISRPILGFLVRDRLGQDLFGENTLPFTQINPRSIEPGREFQGEFIFRLPMLPNGQYAVMASVADGDLHSHIQHHWMHDALILTVSSSRVRWGLVGIPFEKVSLSS